MKTLIAVLIAVASCALRPMPACADVGAELTLTVTGGKLWAHVLVTGIPKDDKGTVMIVFTSPSEMFESSSWDAKYESTPSGTWHTRAVRGLSWTSKKGKTYRASGAWKVQVISMTENNHVKVLAEGTLQVE